MPPVKGTKKNGFFTRDENVLPFFSWHEKTKLGTILRIVLLIFMGFVLMLIPLGLFANLKLSNATTFSELIYIVPIIIAFALIMLALFKR
ncbi:MAG: hypothetical protein IJU28_10770, partial [Clostridia bacterium]|nr:hypothetical protein [Clostridia bacterium]